MNLFFIPQPQRCICLTGSADIGRETPVVLCMPQPDERLVLAAGKLFEHVRTEQGPFALYSENSFAPECPVRASSSITTSKLPERAMINSSLSL